MEKKAEGLDLRSSLLTLGTTDASIVLLSLNRSLPSTLVRTPLLRRRLGRLGSSEQPPAWLRPHKRERIPHSFSAVATKAAARHPEGWRFQSEAGKESRAREGESGEVSPLPAGEGRGRGRHYFSALTPCCVGFPRRMVPSSLNSMRSMHTWRWKPGPRLRSMKLGLMR